MKRLVDRLVDWLFAPQPIVRLEMIRMLAPLAILGFLASRIAYPDDWLSSAGFQLPALDDDWRQPVTFAAISPLGARLVCAGIVASGLAVSLGAFTRWAAAAFAILLAYVALADRMTSFTVSKLGPVIALALCLAPAGTRYSIDAWRRHRRDQLADPAHVPPELCSGGNVRFFQCLLPAFYFASGLCKATGDWLSDPIVLWSHVHGSYQTGVSWFLANHLPSSAWTGMQVTTLVFECGAPVLFLFRRTRPWAVAYGVMMHTLIGTMFGPVAFFSLLMIVLLLASYVPITWIAPTFGRVTSRTR